MKSIDSYHERNLQSLSFYSAYCEWALTVHNAEKCRNWCEIGWFEAKLR